MNVITVKINGVEYNLKGDEREEYLHKIAGYVDKKLKTIMGNNARLSTSSAAVLTAVNVVDDLFKCDLAYKELTEEVEAFEKKEKDLATQMESLQNQIAHLQQSNNELAEIIKNDKNAEILRLREEELRNFKNDMDSVKEVSEKNLSDVNAYKAENKELKFQLQTARYRIIDLQNKLVENQINLVKVKKMNNPLLNNDK